MNELDDFKKIWQEGNQSSMKLERSELERMITKKSTSMLEWLKLIAKIEDWGNFIVTIGFTTLFILLKKWDWAIITAVLMLGISIYYHHLYKIIHRISYSENVLEFLEDTYAAFQSFLKKYLVGLVIVTIISYIIGFSLSFQNENNVELDIAGWIVVIAIGFVGFTISLVLVYLYYYFLYGRKAIKLKKMIKSLKDN